MSEKNFIGFEYKDVIVKSSMSSVYADGYENFGWELDGTSDSQGKIGSILMKFKRNRKIRNKAELTRLQRNFDACVSEIISMEASKHRKASAAAYITGIVGTGFMAGSVFAVTSNKLILCIILAIPAFIGWVLPYLIYRSIEKNKTAEVMPLIDQKYDELYAVCEKANSLLDQK